jgi:hypothetical protein
MYLNSLLLRYAFEFFAAANVYPVIVAVVVLHKKLYVNSIVTLSYNIYRSL